MPQSGVTSEHVTKYTVLPDRADVIYQLEATGKLNFMVILTHILTYWLYS